MKKKNKVIMKRRLIVMTVSFGLMLTALAGRLVSIQLIEGAEYRDIAARQSVAMISGLSTRGTIYDRNGNYITGMKESFVYLIEKRKMDEEVSALLDELEARLVNDYNERYYIYSTFELDKRICDTLCEEYGAVCMKTRQRYSDNQPAVHLIGYVNKQDATGTCGIEKDYDEILSSIEKTYYGQTDGQGFLIPGLGIRMEGDARDWGVLTTLDLNIQRAAEQVLEDASVSGAIIVTNAASGEILASASSPVFSPYEIYEYLDSSDKEFLNKAVCQYPPGSIFKIAVAAAALEKGVITPETVFKCDGYHEVDGVTIKCSTGGTDGHGELTVTEAFSESCNAIFVQIGQLTGGEAILKTADKFGLGKEALAGLSGQSSGNLPNLEDTFGAGIGNLSIGQGKLLLTPMQVARITQIIASGGIDTGMSLISGTVEGIKGTVLKQHPVPVRVISRETALSIKEMMTQTVVNGTADNLDIPEGITASGKTGSAEAAVGEEKMVHGWFTGFVPAENPEYIITVFVENGGSGRKSAVPLFGKMLKALYP